MNTIKSILAATVLTVSAPAMAQNLETGYFNENYLYRHQVNPAFGNEKGYVAMPFILGNMNVGIAGNYGINNLLFNRNGKTVTFLHPDVAKSDFKINDKNRLSEDFKYQLIGVGFKGIGGYNTIELNIRENLNVNVAGDVFRLAKEGIENKTYDLGNLDARAEAYVELGLGHSHKIDDNWRVGGKFKFLVGAANASLITNTAKVTLGKDAYTADLDAEIRANVKGLSLKYDKDGKLEGINELKNPGIGGFGAAFDLGAQYKLDDNWSFSLAVIDLGFIKWSDSESAQAKGSFTTEGRVFNVDDKATNSFDNVMEQMGDDLAELYNFRKGNLTEGQTTMLGTTINVGANWRATFYDKLTFGVLNTTRIQGAYTWNETRISANVRPLPWVSATANLVAGTYGVGFGWMLDLQASKGIDFFIAMDRTPGKLAKQGIPLNSNAEFSMGINFPF